MINFVNLMEGLNIHVDIHHELMDMYWQSDQWILEPLIIGRRQQCLIDKDNITFSAKSEESGSSLSINKVRHIIEDIRATVPDQTLIDGYITYENDLKKTIQIFASTDKNALSLQSEKKMKFIVSDVIFWDNSVLFDFPLFERKQKLKLIKQTENLKIIDFFVNRKYEVYEKLKLNYEAFYFKDFESEYTFGKSRHWKLLKEPKTFFVVIMDVLEGTGKFKNLCGALSVGQFKNGKLQYITNIGGINYDERALFFNQKQKFINKVIEIKALERTEKSFREARYVKVRDDLSLEDCKFVEWEEKGNE